MKKRCVVILLGPQGSGKGTQAQILEKRCDYFHLSTGDLIRKGIVRRVPSALRIKKYTDAGKLVPDAAIMDLVADHLPKTKSVVFDGVPRTLAQAKALESIVDIDAVIELHMSDKESIQRLATRRVCLKCGRTFGGKEQVPARCPCGGKPVQREDDTPAAIKKRLQEYHKKTEPLRKRYEKLGIFHVVKAHGDIERIHQAIKMFLP